MRRTNYLSGGLVSTLENEEIAAAAAAAPPMAEPIGDNADSLETDLIDMADDTSVQNEAEGEVKQACDVVETLESLRDVLQGAAKTGGLDRHGAGVAQVLLHHVYRQVGEKTSSTMPSIESFGGTGERISMTTITLEAIEQKAKEIWAKIVAMWEKLKTWLVELYKKYFDAATKLKARAEELTKKADSADGTAKDTTFDNARIAAALHIGGTVPTDLKAKMGGVLTQATNAFNGQKNFGVSTLKNNAELMSKQDPASFIAGYTLAPLLGDGLHDVGGDAANFGGAKEGISIMRSDEMPGGKAVIAYGSKTPVTGEAGINLLPEVKTIVGDFAGKNNKAPEKALVPTLSKDSAKALADIVVKIADAVLAYQQHHSELDKEKDKMLAAVKGLSAKEETEETKAGFAAMRKVAQYTARIADEPTKSLGAYVINTGKSVLDYVEESLKQYGAAAAAPAAAAPAAKPAEAAAPAAAAAA